MEIGKVFLVGAGPGDIGLITVKGLEAIKKADVILYDRLANPKLLDFAPPHCEFIYGGKLPFKHTLRQEKINSLLVEKAKEGKQVVRSERRRSGCVWSGRRRSGGISQRGNTF